MYKSKDRIQRKTRKRYQNISEEKKTKRASFANMLADDIKVFLKKKKTKSASFAQNNIKIFLKMKQKQVDYRRNYYIYYITRKK